MDKENDRFSTVDTYTHLFEEENPQESKQNLHSKYLVQVIPLNTQKMHSKICIKPQKIKECRGIVSLMRKLNN